MFDRDKISALVVLCAAILSAALFFAPLFFTIEGAKEFLDKEEARVFFVSFFAQNMFFWIHALSAILAFGVFVISLFWLFKKPLRALSWLSILISLLVIGAYLSGYERLFEVFL